MYPFAKSYSCPAGYFFASLTATITIQCEKGMWIRGGDSSGSVNVVSQQNLQTCVEGCKDGCANDGKCVGINICICSSGYEGPTCSDKICPIPSPNDINGNILSRY